LGFRDLFRRRPQNAAEWRARATEALGKAEREKALDAVERALEADPSPELLVELGHLLRDLGALDRAVDVLRLAVERSPGSADAAGHLGMVLIARGEVDQGLSMLETAALLSPIPEVLVAVGRALIEHDRPADAIPKLRQAVALDDGCQPAHALLGKALHQHHGAEAALPARRRACELDATDLDIRIALGVALAKAGLAREGIWVFEGVLRQTSTPQAVLVNMGLAFREAGDLRTAQRYFVDAVRRDPLFAAAQSNLGIALLEDGAFNAAVMTLRKAVELAPEWATAHFNLGLALWGSGNHAEGLEAIRRAVALAPGDAELRTKLEELERELVDRDLPAVADSAPAIPLDLSELEVVVTNTPEPQVSAPQHTSNAAFMGTLDTFSLPDLLEFLKHARRSGVLYVASTVGPGEVRLRQGAITAASSPGATRLGDLLVSEGKLTPDALQNALSLQLSQPQEPFGLLLLELGLIDPEQLRTLLIRQVKTAIQEMMAWQVGTFAFEPVRDGQLRGNSQVELDPSMILLDVLREQDEASATR